MHSYITTSLFRGGDLRHARWWCWDWPARCWGTCVQRYLCRRTARRIRSFSRAFHSLNFCAATVTSMEQSLRGREYWDRNARTVQTEFPSRDFKTFNDSPNHQGLLKKKESATFFRKSVGDLVSMAQPASPVIIWVRNPGPEVEGVDLRAPYGARGFRIRGHWVHLTFAGLYPGEPTKGQVAHLHVI